MFQILQGLLAQGNNGDAAAGAGAFMGISFFCCCYGGLILAGLGAMAFWIWSIIQVATKEPAQDPNKTMWLLIVILLGFIGAVVYFFARRPTRIRTYGR